MVKIREKKFGIYPRLNSPLYYPTCIKKSERAGIIKDLKEIHDLSNMVEGLVNREDIAYEGDEADFDRVENQVKLSLEKVDDLKDCE